MAFEKDSGVQVNKKDVLTLLKDHRAEIEGLGVAHLCLFGSFARDEAAAMSDVDLVATFNPNAKPGLKVVRLRRRLEEILQRPVDLLRAPIRPALQQVIEREGVYAF